MEPHFCYLAQSMENNKNRIDMIRSWYIVFLTTEFWNSENKLKFVVHIKRGGPDCAREEPKQDKSGVRDRIRPSLHWVPFCVISVVGHRHRRSDIHHLSPVRVGNFRQKNNSAEDGIDGTNSYFRRNSGCSAEQKISEFRSEPFRGRGNNSEFRSVEQKGKQTSKILFRTIPRNRTHLGISFRATRKYK